jgi:hypothetical protein
MLAFLGLPKLGGKSSTRVSLDATFLALTVLTVAGLSMLIHDGESRAQPIEWNETVIDTDSNIVGERVVLSGNLTVGPGASLSLDNSTLLVNASMGELRIHVQVGGRFSLTSSFIMVIKGSYTFIVEGELQAGFTGWKGLYNHTAGPEDGIRVIAGGHANLTLVTIEATMGPLVSVADGGRVDLRDCDLEAYGPVVTLDGGASMSMDGSQLSEMYARGPLLTVTNGSQATIRESTLCQGVEDWPISGDEHMGIIIDGGSSSVMLDSSEIRDGYIVQVKEGRFVHTRDGSIASMRLAALMSVDGNLTLGQCLIGRVNITGGRLWLLNGSAYETGCVSGDCTVFSYGPAPPNSTLAPSVTVHHHYRVDFLLLNEARSPAADNSLLVETKDREVVVDTRSGPDGWVRDVWLLSWTRRGATFSYEPSHRVEFGDVDYSITRVQVYGNTTVTLWNSPDQRDLVLLQDAVSITDRSPREGDPFDVVVKGALLIPYTYPNGTSELVLYVDGKEFQSRQFSPTSRKDVTFKGLNLSEGMHEVRVVVDPSGLTPQLNRFGNDEARVIVEVASRNYTGDEIDLYVRVGRIEDTAGNTEAPLAPGVLDVHFTVRARYSTVVQRNVQVQLLVDGEVRGTRWVDLVRLVDVDGKSEYSSDGDIPLNLPEGTYTIGLVVDPGDDFIERYENNNADSATVEVSPKPVQPLLDNWDDPAVCVALGLVALVIVLFAVARNRLSRRGGGAAPVSDVPPVGPKAQGGSAPAPPLAQPQSSREASTMAGAACPACGGGDVVGYPDGSARCQSCKAVFYSR